MIEKIVKLESENMIPILAASGIEITPEKIRSQIIADPTQIIVTILHARALIAVLRYKIERDHIFIKSLQTSDASKFKAIRALAFEAAESLATESQDQVMSVVQKANSKSIKLHKQLGFSEAMIHEKSISFLASRKELIERLQEVNLRSIQKNRR